ncbi:sensor histidine kinase [Microbacterium sp.]|uniref:sensor histidine kinase n=1 Tax=Microbacterium sp. TaxID=51671 RepID=UPI003A927F79
MPETMTASFDDFVRMPELRRLLVDHAYRGFRVQTLVRALAIGYLALTMLLLPLPGALPACAVTLAIYAAGVVAVAVRVRRDPARAVAASWITLYADIAALGAYAVIGGIAAAGAEGSAGRTAQALSAVLFLVPVMAVVQLRLRAAIMVMAVTVAASVAVGVVALPVGAVGASALALHTLLLVGACTGFALLVHVQRSRVLAIGRAALHRQALLEQLIASEDRERMALAERLHDGALQYVLAARQELDELPAGTDSESVTRLRHALNEAMVLLRDQVADLTLAVLSEAGLRVALARLVDAAARRGRFTAGIDDTAWHGASGAAERILYDTARELLANVVIHAGAEHVRVMLASDADGARLAVCDDGRGFAPSVIADRLAHGHIGLTTRRLRLEAVGGALELSPGATGGAVASARIPIRYALQTN